MAEHRRIFFTSNAENTAEEISSSLTDITVKQGDMIVNFAEDSENLYIKNSNDKIVGINDSIKKELIKDEEVVADALTALNQSSGFDEHGNYAAVTNATYISNAISVKDATAKLDAAIKNLQTSDDTLTNNLKNYLPLDGGTMNSGATVKFVEDGKDYTTTFERRGYTGSGAYSNTEDGYVKTSYLTTKAHLSTYKDSEYTQCKNWVQMLTQPDYAASRKRYNISDTSYSFIWSGVEEEVADSQLNYVVNSDNNEYYQIDHYVLKDQCRARYSYYTNGTLQIGIRFRLTNNTALTEYCTTSGYDKMNVGILDKGLNEAKQKVGIEWKYLDTDQEFGCFVTGKTTNDLMTANGGVKTIGTDIASQDSVDKINQTLGDISTILDAINGEVVDTSSLTEPNGAIIEDIEPYTPDTTLREDKTFKINRGEEVIE